MNEKKISQPNHFTSHSREPPQFLPLTDFRHFCLPQPTTTGMSLTDLPASLHLNIMRRLSDGRDIVSVGQVCPDLGDLAEDRLLWKNLCQYHFTDRQVGTPMAQALPSVMTLQPGWCIVFPLKHTRARERFRSERISIQPIGAQLSPDVGSIVLELSKQARVI